MMELLSKAKKYQTIFALVLFGLFLIAPSKVEAAPHDFSMQAYDWDATANDWEGEGTEDEYQQGGYIEPGKVFKVDLYYVPGDTPVTSMQVGIKYDPAVLEPILDGGDLYFEEDKSTTYQGGIWPAAGTSTTAKKKTNWTTLVNDDTDVSMLKAIIKDSKGSSGAPLENEGVLLSYYFKVKDDAAPGTPIELRLDPDFTYVFGNQPKTVHDFSLMVFGAMSTDVTLKTLTLTGNNNVLYPLTPGFTAGTSTRIFDVVVPNKVSSITLAATPTDSEAKVLSGGLGNKPLTVGDNSFNIIVQAQNGKQETYLIRVKRLSNNASLKTLSLTNANLDNPLTNGVYLYTATVPYTTSTTTISATTSDSNAVIATPLGVWNLTNHGTTINTKKITVKAEDCASSYSSVPDNTCTTQDYTLNVTRNAPSTDNNLSDLKVDGVTVSGFSPNTLSYTLPNQTSSKTSISISATASDSKAKITGDIGSKALVVGDNTFTVTVTAEDNTTKNYTIRVRRLSGNNKLATLNVTSSPQGTLSPSFVSTFNGEYTYTYDSTVTSINVAATTEDSNATIVSGVKTYSSSDTGASIVVQAEDGSLNTYNIKFSRNKSSDNNLKSLEINAYPLNETFSPTKTLYTATVPGTTSSIEVAAVANDPNATVTGVGTKNLNYGTNTIQIRVRAENGAEKDYTITVTRSKKDIATLSDLKADGTTVPGFNENTLVYTLADVPFDKNTITITATPKDSDATVEGTGTINLNTGDNEISITVTAHDTVTKTIYKVKVNRAKSDNTYLKTLTLAEKPFTFNKTTKTYSIDVEYDVSTATITAIPEYSGATASVSGPSSLAVGLNTYTITVTAENGNIDTYTLNINRKPSTNTALNNLTVTNGATNYLTGFASSKDTYDITVPNEVDNVDINATLADTLTQTVTGVGNKTLSAGLNTFEVEVTAASGAKKKYTLNITRSKNTNNNLKTLEVAGHTLTPSFSAGHTSYTVTVDSSVDSITIHATPEVPTTTVTGGGNKTLQTGVNTFNIIATSEDNQAKTYVVVVTKQASNDSTLASLSINETALNEVFQKNVYNYTASVANNVSSVTINATASCPNAKSVTGVGPVSLKTGDNIVRVVVTAEDNTTSTYTITIHRAKNNNAFLKNLSVSGGYTLDQTFNKNDENYSLTVPNSAARILVSAETEDVNATLQGAGYVDLKTGDNNIKITVTAEDGTTKKNYTLKVTRQASSNAYLQSLNSTNGLIQPTFNKTQNNYTLTVPYEIENADIQATAEDANASVRISGNTNLEVGPNNAEITVTAEDGTVNVYYLIITRQPSSNNYLSSLQVTDNNGTEYIAVFNKTTMTYNINVANDIDTVTITATEEDPSTTVEGDGVKTLDVGGNRFVVKSISGNGTAREYIINIVRDKNSNANLKSLEVEGQTIVPEFSPNVHSYSLNVDASVSEVNIKAVAEMTTSTVKGTGKKTLVTGLNTFNIEVEAEDKTTRTYVVVINKAASSNNYLASLLLDQPFTPAFDRETLNYNATVANNIREVEVTGVAEDPNATVTGNGVQSLNVGHNQVEITVTAENNTFRIYTIDVYREPSTNNYLSDLKVDGATVEGFNREKLTYKLTVENDVTEVDIQAVLEDASATIASGTGVTHLSTGTNSIDVTVTAEDGTSKIYTLEITRKMSANNNLALLSTLEGMLSPAFTKENTNYTMQVPYEIKELTITAVTEDANSVFHIEGNSDFVVGADNMVYIPVTAEDGTTKTYQIKVTRLPQANNFLTSLTVTSESGRTYPLSPVFNKNTLNYTIEIDEEDSRLTVEGEKEVVSSTATGLGDIDVTAFPYNHQVIVTSAGGIDRVYNITINKIKSSNAKLKDITVSSGTLSPSFDPDTLSYTVEVDSDTSSIDIGAVLNKGQTVAGDGTHNLSFGENTFPLAVTAEDGTTKTYTVKVVREKKIDTTLKDIEVINGTLDPTFESSITSYIAYIGEGVTDVTITPIVNDAMSSVTIALNDGEYQPISSIKVEDLEIENTVKIKVAQDGNETIYQVALLTQSTEKITSIAYGHDISDGMIKTVTVDTTAEEMKDQLDNENEKLKIYLADGTTEYTGDKIGTGMIVKLFIRGVVVDQKVIVVKGDTDGNGEINAIDALKVVNHIIETELLSGCYLVAAETTNDDTINAIDALRIVNHIIGNESLY